MGRNAQLLCIPVKAGIWQSGMNTSYPAAILELMCYYEITVILACGMLL